MISVMREYARSLKIVLLFVVVVFILTSGVLFYFGSGPFSSGGSHAVAVVNGEEIPPERFKLEQPPGSDLIRVGESAEEKQANQGAKP